MTAQCIQRKNIQSFCRTCLAEINKHSIAKGRKYNIHQTQDLAKWIITCTSLKVKKNDGYPKCLCQECFQKLKSLFEFRTVCIKSMRFLDSILGKNDNALPEVLTKTELFDDEDDTPLSITIANKDRRIADKERENTDQLPMAGDNNINYDEDKLDNKLVAEDLPKNSQENIKIEFEEEKVDYTIIANKTFEYRNCEDKSIDEVSSLTDSESEYSSDETIEFNLESDNEFTEENLFKKMSKKKTSKTIRKVQIDTDKKTVSKTVPPKNTAIKFQCEFCARRCISEESLAAHLRVHKGLRPHQCNQCERSFNKLSRLKAHIRENHQDNVEQHTCSFEGCGKQFRRADTLRAHYRIKHKNVGPPTLKTNMCEDCGRTFKNSTTFKEHRFRHRPSEEYPYQCEQCDKRYTSLRTFKEHQQRHAGIKNFVCPYCGMRKTTRKELCTHINYHTKEKQWPCPHCPSVFNSSANLGMHDRVVHKGIRRFSCKYCDQSFGKSDTLKHHEMRHTGEKPHECQLCGKRFIQIVALRAHLKTHNKVAVNSTNKIVKQQLQEKSQEKMFIGEDEVKTACQTLVNDVNVD